MPGIFLPPRSFRQKPPIGARFNPNCPLLHGLQALYLFSEGGGASFAEASGQHPAATIGGGSGSPACWSHGLFGPAAQFTSTIGYANCGNICDNMANFTVSLWLNTGSSSAGTIVGKLGSGGQASGQGWAVVQTGSVNKQFSMFTQLSGGSTYNQIETSSNYADSKWHHGVFVVSNYAASKIYIDGTPVSTSVVSGGSVTTTTNTANLTIGGDSASDWWNGNLDVLGIWNRVLGTDEIERLYIEPFYFMSPGGRTLFSKGRVITAAPVQSLGPDGIVSQEAPGAMGVAKNLLPLGLFTQEAFGATITSSNAARNILPGGILSVEAEGAIVLNKYANPSGIVSDETQGKPEIGLNLLPLGLTPDELLGALKAAIANHAPINIPLRRYAAYAKPQPGAQVDLNSPLAQGLAGGWLLSEGGGNTPAELLTGITGSFAGSPSTPSWNSGAFGPAVHFPGGSNDARIAIAGQPAFTDLGLNGPMSISFWYNYDTAQLALPAGSSVMGKNDSTDGAAGFTHGWVINSDNWHLVSGSPVNSGPQYIKLEFERSGYNKQGGIPAPATAGIWHHIVITTIGGASTPAVNDYAIYLDGILQQNIFFVAGTGSDTTSDSGYNFAIGAHPSGSSPFAGYLDVVLLYNRVLSAAEAQRLYTDPFCFLRRRARRLRATHSTASLSVTPLGIMSAEQLGAIAVPPAQVISAAGIASAEYPGALRAAIAAIQDLYPGSMVTLESLGADTVIVAVPIATPANRILSPKTQYRLFNLTLEERIL